MRPRVRCVPGVVGTYHVEDDPRVEDLREDDQRHAEEVVQHLRAQLLVTINCVSRHQFILYLNININSNAIYLYLYLYLK